MTDPNPHPLPDPAIDANTPLPAQGSGDGDGTPPLEEAPGLLYVFFDANCAFCRRCRRWVERQSTYFPIRFLPYQGEDARRLCPDLDRFHPEKEIVAMSERGAIYTGSASWIMILYATKTHRSLAMRLADPTIRPHAKRICQWVSSHRYRLSVWFGGKRQPSLEQIQALPDVASCADGACRVGTHPGTPAGTPPPLPRRRDR